jgi:predicted Zn-dependent peptidase
MQAAQGVSAFTDPRTGGNSLGMVTVPAMPGAPASIIEKGLFAELDALAADGPGEEELACARAAAGRQMLAEFSSSAGRAGGLAYFAAAFGDPALINTLPDRITAITTAQVREAAATWLRPESAAVVTTRPALPATGGLSSEE